jgi:hypothetical protein
MRPSYPVSAFSLELTHYPAGGGTEGFASRRCSELDVRAHLERILDKKPPRRLSSEESSRLSQKVRLIKDDLAIRTVA